MLPLTTSGCGAGKAQNARWSVVRNLQPACNSYATSLSPPSHPSFFSMLLARSRVGQLCVSLALLLLCFSSLSTAATTRSQSKEKVLLKGQSAAQCTAADEYEATAGYGQREWR